jgi:hypothetical protein
VRCQGCEHPNPADARFCAGCGQPLARVCASCARPNAAAARERELREAHRLYTEMDATGHAERLARELGL